MEHLLGNREGIEPFLLGIGPTLLPYTVAFTKTAQKAQEEEDVVKRWI